MATEFDASEFVDREFEAAQRTAFRGASSTASAAAPPLDGSRAPTREEVDNKVGDLQSKLAELKRAQTELEMAQRSEVPEAVRAHYVLASYYLDHVYCDVGPSDSALSTLLEARGALT